MALIIITTIIIIIKYALERNHTVLCYGSVVLPYFRMKCVWVSLKASSDCPEPINLVVKVIGTAAAVARIAELTIRKTVAVTRHTHTNTSLFTIS